MTATKITVLGSPQTSQRNSVTRFSPPARFHSQRRLASRLEISHNDNPLWMWQKFTPHVLHFQFMDPEIRDEQVPNYEQVNTINRGSPYVSYASTGSREISLSLSFCCAPEQGDRDGAQSAENSARWLQAMTLPVKSLAGSLVAPPVLWLTIGSIFTPALRCVLASCQLTRRGPFVGDALLVEYAMVVEARITLMEVLREGKTADDTFPHYVK